MTANRYRDALLTIIALELGWLALTHTGTPVSAQQAPTRVVITGVDMRPTDAVPVAVQGPVKIEADRPISIQADKPLTVHIPVTTSPRPGL
jgi:hypothetical protein